MPQLKVRTKAQIQEYEIGIGRGLLSESGQVARRCLGKQTQRLAIISNKRIFSLYGPPVVRSLQADGFFVSHWLMEDGERHMPSICGAFPSSRFLPLCLRKSIHP